MHVPEPLVRFAPPVARALARHPDLLPDVRARVLPTRDVLVARALDAAAAAGGDDEAMKRELRRLKYAVVGALVLEDLDWGPDGVDRVGAVLADLADALVQGALTHARARLVARGLAADGWPEDGGFVAFAMGKHGAGELNYSSDIDLIYVATTLEGEARPFADKLGIAIGRLLSDVTADGICFRVDLNLRPEGRVGPLVVSLRAAEHHYLTFGRTWERAAWLKARAAAGDEALGASLLGMLEPFRFRRHLDFGTLDDLGAMRDRIAASTRLTELARDLKRGPGGIREIEFLVQATQLAWIGRDPGLRVPATVPALRALAARETLLPSTVDIPGLIHDYRFLRALEHRIQWEAEAQTQSLPPDDDAGAWARLAEAMGAQSEDALRDALDAVRSRVEGAWSAVFSPDTPQESLHVVDPFATVEERTAQLSTLGFADPEQASARLSRLAEPSAQGRMRPSTWRRFERIAPRLATLAARSGDPDEALSRIERFVSRVGARGTMYELLHENPAAMEILVRLFAESSFLSERFLTHPELLDALVMRGRGGELGPRPAELLRPELFGELALRDEGSDGLLVLRTFQTVEMLRIGLADLGGALPGLPCGPLTTLAEVLLAGADRLASAGLHERHGELIVDGEPVPRAILGLGSLGSGWLNYGSDLDLVFVSRSVGESDGPRPIDGRTYGARHAQRVVTALTAQTREGRCYDVDLRLRPGGQGGPLCTSVEGFSRWYVEHAAPWERLMLMRGRVVWASSPAFRAEVDEALQAAKARVSGGELTGEARRMRERQLEELAAERPRVLDLKLGPGGLTDIEFAVACRQLDVGGAVRDLADPVAALGALPDADARDAATLTEAYTLLRRVESAVRLRSGRGDAHLHLDTRDTARLADALGFRDAESLEGAVRTTRGRVVGIVTRWLAEGSRGGSEPPDVC
jgi:glutamate-ammonia-ligase adenylyltransferase